MIELNVCRADSADLSSEILLRIWLNIADFDRAIARVFTG